MLATFAALTLLTVQVAPQFPFVGEQSFLLKRVADATQRIHAVATPDGVVEKLVWVQYEELRSKRGKGYDYHEDETITIDGTPFALNVRQYASTPPDPDSDRAKVYELLAAHGLRMPATATRVRLVYVSPDQPYSEVMIIYAEAGTPDRNAIVERAKAAFTIARR